MTSYYLLFLNNNKLGTNYYKSLELTATRHNNLHFENSGRQWTCPNKLYILIDINFSKFIFHN